MSQVNTRTKRIFISDIHMGDERSFSTNPPTYPHTYGWFNDPDRIKLLTNFLDGIVQSNDVKELVILGDLFDQWVCPISYNPNITCEPVITAPQNKPIIDMLKAIDQHNDITLTLVPGNHDMHMLFDESFIKQVFPNINIPGGDSPVVRIYQADNNFLAAEHGSQYTMFCSPDTWSNPGGYLPLGFYISRVVADKNARLGKNIDMLDIIIKFVKAFWDDIKKKKYEGLAHDIFLALSGDCGFKGTDNILMNGFDHCSNSITVDEVANRYGQLFCDWEKYAGKELGLSTLDGLLYEILKLQGAAQRMYFSKNKAKVVIFGHTHEPTIEGYHGEHLIKEFIHDIPSDYIYANSGTWVDSHKQCTYVETEENTQEGKYHVRLFQYRGPGKKSKLIMDGFIPLS